MLTLNLSQCVKAGVIVCLLSFMAGVGFARAEAPVAPADRDFIQHVAPDEEGWGEDAADEAAAADDAVALGQREDGDAPEDGDDGVVPATPAARRP